MTSSPNLLLIIGAALSAIAAALHLGIIVGGAPWYRFFGAGERMASAAAAGQVYPALVTLVIATVLALWSAYALAGAGVIGPLPWMKVALAGITAVYLLRGLAIVPLLLMPGKATPFLVWSSLICLGYGAIHLAGVRQVWPAL